MQRTDSKPVTSIDLRFLFSVVLLAGCVLQSGSLDNVAHAQLSPPNIVLIMADDMGYTDIGCYGSEIETPNLDRLAKNGLRLTQFYNTSRCCPTRAALLTGLYSHQAGIGLMTNDRGYDAYRGDLNRRCVTLAEMLKVSNYRSYLSGKWHVTKHITPNADRSNWPLQRGFDKFYGTVIGAGSFYDPATLCRGNTFITPDNDPEYQPKEFYYTDAISDNAVSFMKQHHADQPGKSFFLYVSYTSAHWPMHAPEEVVRKYRGKYDAGYDAIRQARYKRAIELGVIDKQWKLSPGAVEWSKAKNREWEIRCMEVYAAMVDRMDHGIGKIISELERQGQLDNTLIIYLQDNGGCAEGFGRRSNAHQQKDAQLKPFTKDTLQTKIWPPMQTRDGRWVRTGPEAMPGAEDTFVAYGTGWANTSNTPFRGYKHDALEGGISTPLIIHYPRGFSDEIRGTLNHTPAHLIDIMPTLRTVSFANYPTHVDGQKIQPMEGVDLSPLFIGRDISRRDPLFFEHHGNKAARHGKWKIVSQYRRNAPDSWQLYNMEADRTELNDLSESHPKMKATLVGQWNAWATRVGVQPWPFPSKK